MKLFLQGKSATDIAKVTLPVALQSPDGVYTRFGIFGWAVHIARPEAAKALLLNMSAFEKNFTNTSLGAEGTVIGRLRTLHSIISVDGAQWKAHRMIVNPAFHRSMPIELFGRLTTELFGISDESISHGSASIDFQDLNKRWALEALGLASFHFNFNAIADRDNEWGARYSIIAQSMFDPLFLMYPSFDNPPRLSYFPKREKIQQEVTKFIQMLDGIIENKRRILSEDRHALDNVKDSEKDLLTLMLEARLDGKGALSDQDLRANLVTFFMAGHDTTASALSSAIYHLAVNQDIQKRAREHVVNALGDDSRDIVPTSEQSLKMPYINMIIKETLRINPPAGETSLRAAAHDIELAGTVIPKGTVVFAEMYELHHNPTIWKDPETFNPERFAPGGEAEKLGNAAWLTFGSGPRQCLGMNFSLAEQRVFLPMLLRKYEWSLPEDSIHKDGLVTEGYPVAAPKDLYIVVKQRY
ncbi:cytochrome P-450 cyp509A1 [Fennellomyces sp. T-0311]|nr:cytochrome P-450 cyp509A1 [Fennellomyces sp. T-0311]